MSLRNKLSFVERLYRRDTDFDELLDDLKYMRLPYGKYKELERMVSDRVAELILLDD